MIPCEEASRAEVILRPVTLIMLEELLRVSKRETGNTKRLLAHQLVFGSLSQEH
jgi:hypothetical protein